MIVVMKASADEAELAAVVARIEELGYRAHVMHGVERKVIGCLGDERGKSQLHSLSQLNGVEKVVPILSRYKLAGRELQKEPTQINFSNGSSVGGKQYFVIAGPCSVESEEQIVAAARLVKAAGATALRGGAYKPRSSTYSFQGLGEQGLQFLATAKQETGLPIVTEVVDRYVLDAVYEYADVIQVGARNMQNFSLLRALGEVRKPILLKRGMSATVEELLMSAEYILAEGNQDVILCERGIRTFETATRNTLDLNAVPALRARTHLPIIVDPSHGTGVWEYVGPMAKAALAAGANGMIIEVHPDPAAALSDGDQSLKPATFAQIMIEMEPIAKAVGMTLGSFDSAQAASLLG